jgi:predicted outer membrane protein
MDPAQLAQMMEDAVETALARQDLKDSPIAVEAAKLAVKASKAAQKASNAAE